ncbi:MAG TPA: site-specific integrase [Verrucomicrobiae bacterium]|nr:site-specific integrase [Verrucomicrobiae bacterium]
MRKKQIHTELPNPTLSTDAPNDIVRGIFNKYGQISDKFKKLMGQPQYREAVLKKTGKDWYIEYQYRYPVELKPPGKRFERFRDRSDINYVRKHKGDAAAEEYAAGVIQVINNGLRSGIINPFADEGRVNKIHERRAISENSVNMNTALELFIQNRKSRKLSDKTIIDYENLCKWFKEWLSSQDLLKVEPGKITTDHIETFLSDCQEERNWSPRTRNNYKEFVSSIFIFLRDKKQLIQNNPAIGIDAQKTKATKNTYYDTELAKNIKEYMAENDAFMHSYCQYIYYSCSRPKKEARFVRIGDIDTVRGTIRITDGKTGERFVPLCTELKEWFDEINIYQYPRERFLFGPGFYGSQTPVSVNFFTNRYKPIKDKFGLDRKYSIYGWKHNRCIDLIRLGLTLAEAMQLTGHDDYTSFENYIRDLGAAMSGKVVGETVRF